MNHRYPFYMLACIDTEWKLLTWLRYTIWIPLYPLGVLAEGMCSQVIICRLLPEGKIMMGCSWKVRQCIMYTYNWQLFLCSLILWSAVAVIQSIPIFDESKLLSIPLPKAIGTSLSFSYILQLYLMIMFLGKVHKTHAKKWIQGSSRNVCSMYL